MTGRATSNRVRRLWQRWRAWTLRRERARIEYQAKRLQRHLHELYPERWDDPDE